MPRKFPWAVLVFAVAVLIVGPALHLRPTQANPLVVAGMLAVITIVHEAGHVIAAVAVGHRIFEVRIGVGPAVRIPIGRARLEIGLFPIGGHVANATPHARRFRLKRFVVFGAGPLMNGILVLIALMVHASSGSLLYDLALLNGLVLLGNLVPYTGVSAFGPQPTDGLSLFRILVMSPREMDEQLAVYYVAEAQRLSGTGEREEPAPRSGAGWPCTRRAPLFGRGLGTTWSYPVGIRRPGASSLSSPTRGPASAGPRAD